MVTPPAHRIVAVGLLCACVLCPGHALVCAASLRDLVGDIEVKPLTGMNPVTVPVLLGGADLPLIHANGGAETAGQSVFAQQGLSVLLVYGGDFPQQVRAYMQGQSPFLRASLGMIGMASEVLAASPGTEPVVVALLGWATGERLVARVEVRSTNDLKGRSVALSRYGPHLGMLDDALRAARLTWGDIHVIWAEDRRLSPAAIFQADQKVSAALVGMREAADLLKSGAGNVREVVSAKELSRSIAQVLVCRRDFFEANRESVLKLVTGCLKADEELVAARRKAKAGQREAETAILQQVQAFYTQAGASVPDPDIEALLEDCRLADYAENVRFFTGDRAARGFEAMRDSALQLAQFHGIIGRPGELSKAKFDYQAPQFMQYLTDVELEQTATFNAEVLQEEFNTMSAKDLDEATIASFTVTFEPNQTVFDESHYREEFRQVVAAAAAFANAAIVIRGHSDPTRTLATLVAAGLNNGVLTRGTAANAGTYALSSGEVLSPESVSLLKQAIADGRFEGVPQLSARQVYQATLTVSLRRAMAVRDAIIQYTKANGIGIEASQLQPVGVGVREPLDATPGSLADARKNMRVEFRVVKAKQAQQP